MQQFPEWFTDAGLAERARKGNASERLAALRKALVDGVERPIELPLPTACNLLLPFEITRVEEAAINAELAPRWLVLRVSHDSHVPRQAVLLALERSPQFTVSHKGIRV